MYKIFSLRRYGIELALLSFFIFTCIPSSALAEEMDIETAVALALKSNLGVSSEMVAVQQKRLVAQTWWNALYPRVSASTSLRRSNLEPKAQGEADKPPQWGLSASLNFSLQLTGQILPGITLARLDYEAGLITLADARKSITRDVSKQFYNLLVLQEQLAVTKDRIAQAERRFNTNNQRYKTGIIDEYTLLSSQVTWEQLKPSLTDLQVQYQRQLLAFKHSLGIPLTQEVEPVGTIDVPHIEIRVEDVSDADLQQTSRMQELAIQQQSLLNQKKVAFLGTAGYIPNVQLTWTLDPSFSKETTEGERISADPWSDNWFDFNNNWKQQQGSFIITITQPLDGLIPRSRTRNQQKNYDTQIEQNQIKIAETLRNTRIQIQAYILSIRTSQEKIIALTQNVSLANRAYELAEIGYENGLREIMEVQDASISLKNARFQLLQEKKQLLDTILELEYFDIL